MKYMKATIGHTETLFDSFGIVIISIAGISAFEETFEHDFL